MGLTGVALALTVGGATSGSLSAGASLAGGSRPSATAAVTRVVASAGMVTARKAKAEIADPVAKSGAHFIFQIEGAPFLHLEDFEDGAAARHTRAPLRMVTTGSAVFSFAPLEAAEIPAPYRGWIGREVIAGAGCRAKVTGLAVVAQLVGDSAYADLDGDWTAASVFEHGTPMLAARLDGCGDERLAREASRGAVTTLETRRNPKLVTAARRALLASPEAVEAEARWVEGGGRGRWQDAATLDVRVLRHPTTQVTWVVAFARNELDDCGLPETNLLGTYQVDAAGKLRAVSTRLVSELHELDAVVDLEGDGKLELLGKPWLGYDRLITDGEGEVLSRLEVPFYGCPC